MRLFLPRLFPVICGILLAVRIACAVESQPAANRTFPLAAAGFSGQFTRITGNAAGKPVILLMFTGIDSTADLLVTGTSLTAACYVTGNDAVEVQIDGGAWTSLSPVALNAPVTMPIFSGLPDTAHHVTLRAKLQVYFYLNDTTPECFTVRGAHPTISVPAEVQGTQFILGATAPDVFGRVGILPNLRLEAGYAARQLRGYDMLQPGPQVMGATNGYINYTFGAMLRFTARVRELAIWTYLDGSKYALVVNGKLQPPVSAPVLHRWGWLTLSTSLDPGKRREYAIVAAFFLPMEYNAGSGGIYALRTRGGNGISSGDRPAERKVLACYGDSITANQISLTANSEQDPAQNDSTRGWIFQLGQALNLATVNLGIGSTTVHDFSGNTGSVAEGGREYITTDTGEARTGNITGLAPAPAAVVILYGTNDLGQAWVPSGCVRESLEDFAASYRRMLKKIVAGLPAGTGIYCIGILPRSDYPAQEIAAWNAAIRLAVDDADDARIHYVDPAPWKLTGKTGKDYVANFLDGLHPNAAGKAIIAARLAGSISRALHHRR